MQARKYVTENRGDGRTAVIKIGSKGGRKTIAVYADPHRADALLRLMNNLRDGEI